MRNLPLGNSTYNGGAANAFSASNLNSNISGGQGVLQQSCHPYDPVCRVIGANPASQNNGTATFLDGIKMETHGSYSGYLPPSYLQNGTKYDFRDVTDRAWGSEQYSMPIIPTSPKVSPTGLPILPFYVRP